QGWWVAGAARHRRGVCFQLRGHTPLVRVCHRARPLSSRSVRRREETLKVEDVVLEGRACRFEVSVRSRVRAAVPTVEAVRPRIEGMPVVSVRWLTIRWPDRIASLRAASGL